MTIANDRRTAPAATPRQRMISGRSWQDTADSLVAMLPTTRIGAEVTGDAALR